VRMRKKEAARVLSKVGRARKGGGRKKGLGIGSERGDEFSKI